LMRKAGCLFRCRFAYLFHAYVIVAAIFAIRYDDIIAYFFFFFFARAAAMFCYLPCLIYARYYCRHGLR